VAKAESTAQKAHSLQINQVHYSP